MPAIIRLMAAKQLAMKGAQETALNCGTSLSALPSRSRYPLQSFPLNCSELRRLQHCAPKECMVRKRKLCVKSNMPVTPKERKYTNEPRHKDAHRCQMHRAINLGIHIDISIRPT
eukprot:4225443-Pleurochrysis_carterae.AAC.2